MAVDLARAHPLQYSPVRNENLIKGNKEEVCYYGPADASKGIITVHQAMLHLSTGTGSGTFE